jgi:hypothetical protein
MKEPEFVVDEKEGALSGKSVSSSSVRWLAGLTTVSEESSKVFPVGSRNGHCQTPVFGFWV